MKKKKILSAILAACAVGGILFSTFSTSNISSALVMANLEALGYTEGLFQCAAFCKYRSGYVCSIEYPSSAYTIYCAPMVPFYYL